MDKKQSARHHITIRKAGAGDIALLRDMALGMRLSKDPDYYERCLESQGKGVREILIARLGDTPAGYGILNWQPKYAFFRAHNLPEVQDLNVLPAFRRRGIATAIIRYCEERARSRGHDRMGIGVGLTANYGPAQILYARLGYIPDGNGLTRDRQPVTFGSFVPADDDLCVMMVRDL